MDRIRILEAELAYEYALQDKRDNPENYDRETFHIAAEQLREVREQDRTENPQQGSVNPGAIGAAVVNPNDGVAL